MFYQNHRPYLPINTPKPPSKRGGTENRKIAERFGREHPKMSFRDPFELDTRERRHRRPHRPSAPLQVGGQQGIHPLPEISPPWSTTLRLASWGKVLVCSWGCKEILSCNCRILYENDLSRFLLMMLWCLIVRDLALGALFLHGLLRLHQLSCSCWFVTDYPRVVTVCGRERFWSWNTPLVD